MQSWQVIQRKVLFRASLCMVVMLRHALGCVWRWSRRVVLWIAGLVLGILGFGSAVGLLGAHDVRSAIGPLLGLLIAGLALWVVAFGDAYQVTLRDGRQILMARKKRLRC
jgi:CHASE2 domain-containing sensor protein